MKPGVKPKPTAELKVHGTFRKDRHADRADVLPPSGEPVKPIGMGETESALWDAVVPELARRRLVGSIDSAQLASMCELWGLYRRSYELAKENPIDKENRCAVTGYWAAFDRVSSKFGLTSYDLAALKVEPLRKDEGLSARKQG